MTASRGGRIEFGSLILGAMFWAGGLVGLESDTALTAMTTAINLVAGTVGVWLVRGQPDDDELVRLPVLASALVSPLPG